MTDKTKRTGKGKPQTDPTVEKNNGTAEQQVQAEVPVEAAGDTESAYTPRSHVLVSRLDRTVPLDARVIASMLYDGSFNMLSQLDEKLAECVSAGLIRDANLMDPSTATDSHEENTIEEHNVYCMTAQIANFMTVMGAALEVVLENTEKLKKGAKTPVVTSAEPLMATATLKSCEGCNHRPSVYFDNCQIGTVVNGDNHDHIGGNVQNFSGGDDEERYGDMDEDDEACPDCGCGGSGCTGQYCPAAEGELDCPKFAPKTHTGGCQCGKCTGECGESAEEQTEYASELERIIVTLCKEGNDPDLILATVTDILKVYKNTHGEDVKE